MRIALVDVGRDVVGRLGVGQRVQPERALDGGVADGNEAANQREAPGRAKGGDEGRELGRHEEGLRLRVLHDRSDLVDGEARVHRHHDRAELDRREVHERVLDPIRRQDRDPITASHAEPRQRAGELVRARMELAVGQPIGADGVGDLAATDGSVSSQDVAQHEHRMVEGRILHEPAAAGQPARRAIARE